MDVRNHTTSGDRRLDHCIELLVTSDGQLQVSGCDAFHLQILASVACELQNFSRQVLENGCSVDCGCCTDTTVRTDSGLEESMDSSDRELAAKTGKLKY